MGAFTSRQNAGVEEVDIVSNHAYKYPPRSGNYFGSHFIMGGERFDTPQPEAYLFGENADLNFLGSRPTPFPYPPPQANEPTKTLKSLVNIRKESLKFIKLKDPCVVLECSPPATTVRDEVAVSLEVDDVPLVEDGVTPTMQPDMGKPLDRFGIEFTFDCDTRCAITIHYLCTEDITSGGVVYTPRDPSMSSETFRYERGANQHFSHPSHWFEPGRFSDGELMYHHLFARQMSSNHQGQVHGANGLHNAPNGVHHSSATVESGVRNMSVYDLREVYPIVIHCVAEEEDGVCSGGRQSHATIAVVERHSDGSYVLKALKQKLFVDGLCYLLQEIYGIENKNPSSQNATSTFNDSNTEAPVADTAVVSNEEGVTLADALPLRVALTDEAGEEGGEVEGTVDRGGTTAVAGDAAEDDEEGEDGGSECVICMCDPRDTLILPCRHLCLCNSCADSLRYQANNCPICRAPFRALLQIRALQRIAPGSTAGVGVLTNATEGSCDNIPSGYETVSLIEALNGPCQNRSTALAPSSQLPSLTTTSAGNQTSASPRHVDALEGAVEAARILNSNSGERRGGAGGRGSEGNGTGGGSDGVSDGLSGRPTSEFRMSVLASREGSGHSMPDGRLVRDKSALRGAASRLLSTAPPQSPNSTPPESDAIPPGADAEESDTEPDSEAEKTSPLLDAATSTDPLPLGVSPASGRRGEGDSAGAHQSEDGERRVLQAWKWILAENGDPRGSVPPSYGHMGDDSDLSEDMSESTAEETTALQASKL
ncbi:E3 ubiquitin ligase Rnf157 isoform X2 [Ischnura elegans]|uniref:E3 ubiquitin ligase Rnf157 isoform X2 n=1 Tax=Ischnura elegans TaxID=197161 RepID=UPI001ED8B07C|nr:E3 ubiquitin ligase Rnf157 isoform X2 [Ischnura elegans]